jgi:hypothetical protein
MIRRSQDFAEELLGSRGIPLLREIEVECGATRVQPSVQIDPVPGDANLGFINSPGGARPFQLPPHPPVEFGSVALHPARNRRVIDAQTAFRHQFLQISIAKREAQIPADAEDDDLFLLL